MLVKRTDEQIRRKRYPGVWVLKDYHPDCSFIRVPRPSLLGDLLTELRLFQRVNFFPALLLGLDLAPRLKPYMVQLRTQSGLQWR